MSEPEDPDGGVHLAEADLSAALEEERRRTDERIAHLERDHAAIVASVTHDPPDDEHDPEGATRAFERQQLAALLEAARAHRDELDAAGDRLAAGTAGICETCGGPVHAARLQTLPAARTCVSCAD